MERTLLAVIVLASVAGCATSNAPPLVVERSTGAVPAKRARPPFPVGEYAALPKTGTASLTGQAFLKTRGGDVKTAAGNTIYLSTVTSYSTATIAASGAMDKWALHDPLLSSYERITTADVGGNFKFKNVPSGRYYVYTRITWEAATGYGGHPELQGGWIWTPVTLQENELTELMVTE